MSDKRQNAVFYASYDFGRNLVDDEDEDHESDTVVIEEREKFNDSSSDGEHKEGSESDKTEID